MYLLTTEFQEQKSETVAPESALEQVILDLLHQKQFFEAIELLKNVTSPYRLMELAREALAIAGTLKSVEVIKALTALPFKKHDRQSFFIHALNALMSISEDAALGLVFFRESSEEDQDVGWMFLAKNAIEKNELVKLEKIYHQLSERYHRSEIEEYFLASECVRQDCRRWFVWFGRYCASDQRRNISRFLEQAINILRTVEDVDLILSYLPKNLAMESSQALFQGLYMIGLKSELFSRCQLLEEKCGKALEGFSSVRALVTSGVGFEALRKVPYSDREKIVSMAVLQVIQHSQEENLLSKTILTCADAVPEQRKIIIDEAIKQCNELQRYNVVIELLPNCEEYARQQCMMKMAEGGRLSEVQQATLLRYVKFESHGSGQLCQLLLPELVLAERSRRAEEELVNVRARYSSYLKLKNIGQKHEKYLEVSSAVNVFTRLGRFQEAVKLCGVFGPSNSRDNSVDAVVTAVLSVNPVDFKVAAEASRLYREKSVAVDWSTFFTVCSQGKDQVIIKSSVKLTGRRFVQPLISEIAIRLLSSDAPNNAIELMKACGFLNSHWCDHSIKAKVVSCIITHHQKNLTKLVKRLKTWIDDKIEGYDDLVLDYLLENHQLRQAILLLNALVREGWYGRSVDERSMETVLRYLQDQPAHVSLFESVKLLEVESGRLRLMRAICDKAMSDQDASSIALVKACSDGDLRQEYLKALVKSFILKESFDLAAMAVNSMILEKQPYWRVMVQCAQCRDYQGIIDHWIARSRFCEELTHWVASRWIESQSSVDLIKNFQRLYGYRQSLEKPIVLTDESKLNQSMSHYKRRFESDKILLMIVRKWFKTFLPHPKVSISVMTKVMEIILPWLKVKERWEKQEFLDLINEKILDLLSKQTFPDLQCYIVLLQQNELLSSRELDSYVNRLIELEMYSELELQMQFSNMRDADDWRSRVRERLVQIYVDKRMFEDIVRLLPDEMNFSERNSLTTCVLRHVEARRPREVGLIIQKLLSSQREQNALPIVNSLIEAGYVAEANSILRSHVRTPSQLMVLGNRLKACYWKTLAIMLNPEGEATVNFISTACEKIIIIKRNLESGDHQEAIRLQTEIVQEMRRQLEIAFRAYCENAFPAANINYLFFPLVKAEERHDPTGGLEALLGKYRLPDFRRRQADMFAFMLSIQPVVSPDYQWLETLCQMVNKIKHQENIELNEVSEPFLTQVVNGVTLILLKLRNPRLDVGDGQNYLPREYVDLASNQADSASFQASTKLV